MTVFSPECAYGLVLTAYVGFQLSARRTPIFFALTRLVSFGAGDPSK
jgi:hypothetical protein